jgi:hypothetical protein
MTKIIKYLYEIMLASVHSYSLASTSNWITVSQTFVKKPSNVTSISVPCFDCPDKDEIERRGLPTFY